MDQGPSHRQGLTQYYIGDMTPYDHLVAGAIKDLQRGYVHAESIVHNHRYGQGPRVETTNGDTVEACSSECKPIKELMAGGE